MMDNRQTLISQVCRETASRFIAENDDCNSPWDINNGLCDEFADTVEKVLRTQHKVNLFTLDLSAICLYHYDEIELSEKVAEIFTVILDELTSAIASYGNPITLEQLISDMPYHIFLYDQESGRYYDAELPDGSETITDIPLIKNLMLFSLMNGSTYFQDKPDELKALVLSVMKSCLAGEVDDNDERRNIAADIIKDAAKACPSLSLEVEQLFLEAREALDLTKA
jgi:ferredoxin